VNIVIKDDFLDDYKEAREIALSCSKEDAVDSNDFIFNDLISNVKRDTLSIQKEFRELLKDDVYLVENDYRKFNVCMEDSGGYHIHHDDVDYIGIVYLNDTYTEEDGTQFLRHKETGIDYRNVELFGSQFISESGGDNRDISKWDSYLQIKAKPNRLVLFEPLYYHSEMRTFGNDWNNARCVEIFHMVKKNRVDYWCDYYDVSVKDLNLVKGE
jgi:hypothetical protein